MKRHHVLASLVLAINAPQALAGIIEYQDVRFSSDWESNRLTIRIDAQGRSGDWAAAESISAIGVSGIGSFANARLVAAPGGAMGWTYSNRELTAKGCSGGGATSDTRLCFSGPGVALSDGMVFTFSFDGDPVLASPHLKVNFLDAGGDKEGSLLSQVILATVPAAPSVPGVPAPLPDPAGLPAPLPETGGDATVSEPRTLAMLLGGLGLIGLTRRVRAARR